MGRLGEVITMTSLSNVMGWAWLPELSLCIIVYNLQTIVSRDPDNVARHKAWKNKLNCLLSHDTRKFVGSSAPYSELSDILDIMTKY